MSYRISYTAGSLIPSFCLSIKGRHDAPSLSRALMVKNLTWLSMFVLKSFCSSQRLTADVSWNSQLVFLCYLLLPVNVRKHLLWIIDPSICQDGIKDSYQLTADGNHGLFLLEQIVRSCRVILVQWLKLWIFAINGIAALNSTARSLFRPLLLIVVCPLCFPEPFSHKESPASFCTCLGDSKRLTSPTSARNPATVDHSYTFDDKQNTDLQ